MEPKSYTKLFLKTSALLTGFSTTELKGTGMLEAYYNTILKNSEKEDVDYFFLDFETLLNDPSQTPESIDASIEANFMPDACYGGLTKSIITLWYTGNWAGNVVSSASYIQGLMWDAAHTHPPGAKQPGYGSWANLPISVK